MGLVRRALGCLVLVAAFGSASCADGNTTPSPGRDVGPRDTGVHVTDTGDNDANRPDTGPADAGMDAPLPHAGVCEACVAHAQCGATARCVTLSDGTTRACLQICDIEVPGCSRGFSCVMPLTSDHLDTPVCVPVGTRCCVDEDADDYGHGAGCSGLDCDDHDIHVHPGADEHCNADDDDCDTTVDEMVTDCAPQRCDAAGMAFEQTPPATCSSGSCVAPGRSSCALYSCDMGGDVGDFCSATCSVAGVDTDGYCIASAHCDLGVCNTDFTDGAVCDEDTDCSSSHCDNNFCCGGGTCCNVPADCPSTGGIGTTCDDTVTCQGTRGDITCDMNRCGTRAGVPDDSACNATIEADTCGLYHSVFCNGATSQTPPRCPTSCASDADCDSGAHCDGVCVANVPDGGVCDEQSDCVSAHCNHNLCCSGGDCCTAPMDCPASYSSPPVCDSAATCQGTRNAASCVLNVCGTVMGVADDSACTASTLASDCGLFPSRFCSGGTDQLPPMCAVTCMSDAECDTGNHCDAMTCVPNQPDGTACDENSDCTGNHCQNGFCCASGDCCSTAANCPSGAYGVAAVCDTQATCQGTRHDPVCSSSFQCQVGPATPDDSACNGLLSNACGLYPSINCTAAMSQPTDQMSLCPMMCTTSTDCDAGAYCMGGMCMPRGHAGDACTATGQCDAGLTCTDGVCCNSACNGTCQSCRVAGSVGTCTNIPSGTDPDNECGSVSCTAYYFGYVGSVCYRRSDAPASAVDCNGSGVCETASVVCPGQGQGGSASSCDAVCQMPTAGTCTGMSGGSCTNITAGNISCGTGQCSRTIARCAAGAQQTCVPGSPTTETCNGLDDDCNSSIDDGLSGDVYESNNSCSAVTTLGTVTTSNAAITINATLYGTGDQDFFRIPYQETDSSCGACGGFLSTDEDYAVDIQLTVPANAGSYTICTNPNSTNSCGTFSNCITVAAGTMGQITVGFDGGCDPFSSDSGNAYVRVSGNAAPGFQCNSYTLHASVRMACGY